MNLSTNFTLAQLTRSNTATRWGIDNTPTAAHIENLRKLCLNALEYIHSWHTNMTISSGYRSHNLNLKVNGSQTSQHCKGEAADIEVPTISPRDLFDWIKASEIEYDQLILEFDSWVHVSYRANPRKECLIAKKVNGKTVYEAHK